jgi:hypothetical protein
MIHCMMPSERCWIARRCNREVCVISPLFRLSNTDTLSVRCLLHDHLCGLSSWLQNADVWIYICYVEESRLPLWSSGQNSWLQNRDVLCFLWGTNWIYICCVVESRPPVCLVVRVPGYWAEMCFLWGTNWIYICYVEESRPPLWSSGQSS